MSESGHDHFEGDGEAKLTRLTVRERQEIQILEYLFAIISTRTRGQCLGQRGSESTSSLGVLCVWAIEISADLIFNRGRIGRPGVRDPLGEVGQFVISIGTFGKMHPIARKSVERFDMIRWRRLRYKFKRGRPHRVAGVSVVVDGPTPMPISGLIWIEIVFAH